MCLDHSITPLFGLSRQHVAWLWTVVNGGVVTLIAAFGFKWIVLVAWITGPAFFIVVIWACIAAIHSASLEEPTGNPELSLLQGTGVVVGGYIVGSIVVSDAFRFCRSKRHVVSQVILPRTLSIMAPSRKWIDKDLPFFWTVFRVS